MASWSWLCSAVLRHHRCRASAQRCTAMTNWPNTIQCLGSDNIMPLGIKSPAAEAVVPKFFKTWKSVNPRNQKSDGRMRVRPASHSCKVLISRNKASWLFVCSLSDVFSMGWKSAIGNPCFTWLSNRKTLLLSILGGATGMYAS